MSVKIYPESFFFKCTLIIQFPFWILTRLSLRLISDFDTLDCNLFFQTFIKLGSSECYRHSPNSGIHWDIYNTKLYYMRMLTESSILTFTCSCTKGNKSLFCITKLQNSTINLQLAAIFCYG